MLASAGGAFASEADLKIPNLDRVTFSSLGGASGHTLMLLGLAVCVLGGLFGHGAPSTGGRQRMSTGEMVVRSAVQSAARSAGTQISRAILRGILGGMSRN